MRAALVVLLVLGMGLPARAGQALPTKTNYTVTVRAAEAACTDLPVTVTVPAAASGTHSAALLLAGRPVPATVLVGKGKVEVTWVLDRLAKGQSRQYVLKLSPQEPAPQPAGQGVEVQEITSGDPPLPDGAGRAIAISVDGRPFTRVYCQVQTTKPYAWPLLTAAGVPVTRAWPMQQAGAGSKDHPHQRSMWFTHGDVNGVDFWSETAEAGRVVHRDFLSTGRGPWAGGPTMGVVRTGNDWLAPDGTKVCEDERTYRVYRTAQGRLLDFEINIKASEGPVKFGDTKEGTFGLRVADSMTVIGGQGHITNAAGQRDGDTWGKPAAWCDYTGPVDGKTVGVAIFDHPANLRHPTWWHVRDYGLFAANPFGLHDFNNVKGEPGAYTLPAGQTLTFRYRLYLHDGPAAVDELAAMAAQYAHPPTVEVK